MKLLTSLFVILLLSIGLSHAQKDTKVDRDAWWKSVSSVEHGLKTHVVPSLWGKLPRLGPKSKVTILDVKGPGVVRTIHATTFVFGPGRHGFSGNSPGAQGIIVRVFYDGETQPAIEMPFVDFFGDIQSQSVFFDTEFFSKVSQSHNFRLPMPFRKQILIELENPSEEDFGAYCEIQWDQVDE